MKTRILMLCLLVWAMCLAATAFASEPDVAALVSAEPRAGGFPQADAVTLYHNTEYEVASDGRVTRRVHTLVRILTDWGMRRLSDTRVNWDSDRQELEINVCRTHIPGGTILDTPPNGFNEVTPDAVARSAVFLGIREMVISHVGVEAQAVLELDYTIRDLAPGPLPAGGREFLQGRWPTGLRRVSITVAPGVPLKHEIQMAPASWSRLSDDGRSLVVRAVELPGVPTERNTAHAGDYLPSVVFGTGAPDWETLARRVQIMCEISAKADQDMVAWLARTDDATDDGHDLTPLDTVQRIAHLVGAETRTVDLPAGLFSRAPRTAGEVFASAVATRWEKALLAVALLRQAGLEPEIGFASHFESFAQGTPSLGDFNDLRVVVPVRQQDSGQNWWLSPGRDRARPGKCALAGHTILFIENKPGAFRSYKVPPATGASLFAADIAPADEGGFSARIEYSANGLLCGDEIDAESLADALGGALLNEVEIVSTEVLMLSPQSVHLRVEALGETLAGTPDDDSDVIVFELPSGPQAAIDLLPASCRINAESRFTTLFMAGEMKEELRLRLTLPEDMDLDFRPADIELEGAGGHYSCTGSQAGKTVSLTRQLRLPGGRISPLLWPELRGLLAATTAPQAGRLVLLTD